MNEIYELFQQVKEMVTSPPVEELAIAIEAVIEENTYDDLTSLLTAAFYAGMLMEREEDPIKCEISADDALRLIRNLTHDGETPIVLYLGERN